MAKPRPVFHRELGRLFTEKRTLRGWSQGQAVLRSRQLGAPVSLNSLRYLEEGKTKYPDADALRALSKLYDLDYEDLVARFVRANYDITVNNESHALLIRSEGDVTEFASVRVLEDRIAAGSPLIINESDVAGQMAFSRRSLDRMGITAPVCVRVGRRERSMAPTIQPDDMVLLDCSDERRMTTQRDRIYAVNVDGGATLKRIVQIEGGIALVADNPDKETYPTNDVLLEEGQSLFDIVIGQAMWWGQQL